MDLLGSARPHSNITLQLGKAEGLTEGPEGGQCSQRESRASAEADGRYSGNGRGVDAALMRAMCEGRRRETSAEAEARMRLMYDSEPGSVMDDCHNDGRYSGNGRGVDAVMYDSEPASVMDDCHNDSESAPECTEG